MMSAKIDFNAILTRFIEQYPNSVDGVRGADERFWERFK